MKIVRATQISLKEFRQQNGFMRFVSNQYSNTTPGLPLSQYRMNNKVKSKDKNKRSKLSEFIENIRKCSDAASLKQESLKSTSQQVLYSLKSKQLCPTVIRSHCKGSHKTDKLISCDENLRASSYYATAMENHPIIIINSIESLRRCKESSWPDMLDASRKNGLFGSTLMQRSSGKYLKPVRRQILTFSIIWEILNPKILSKIVVEKALKQVASLVAKTNHVQQYEEIRNVNVTSDASLCSKCNSKDTTQTKSYIYGYINEIRSIVSPRTNMLYCQYSTDTELLSLKDPFSPSNYKYFHTSHGLNRIDKIEQEERLVRSKKITSSEAELIKGGNAFVASTRSEKCEQEISMEAFDPTNRQITAKDFMRNYPKIPDAVAMTNVNSFVPSAPQEVQSDIVRNRTTTSQPINTSNDIVEEEDGPNDTSNIKKQEPVSFRSTLYPEFVRPKIASYEFQFDEDSAPHVAMLSTFCSPLPIDSQRENIIPIQVIEEEPTTRSRVNMHKTIEYQGLLKSVFDKINHLKWN